MRGLGARLSEIAPTHRGFVDEKLAALAEQLRQLDCAVLLGTAEAKQTQRLYDQIVVDLGGQARLMPPADPCHDERSKTM
jgi:hypothetical protein